MTVKQIMTRNPVTVPPDEDVYYAFYLLKKHDIRQLPVVSDNELLGIVTERDLRMLIERPPVKISSAMSTNVVKIDENESLIAAARQIQEKKINALPVLSGDNRLVGIITVTDVLSALINEVIKDGNYENV